MARLALLLSLSPLAFAFSNTSPLLAWSTHRSSAIDRLPLPGANAHSFGVLESIISGDEVCIHDAVVIVEHPGLHASDLRNLPRSSHVARSLSSAPSSRQFAYLSSHTESAVDISSFAQSVSDRCNSKLVYTMPGQGAVSFTDGHKSVVVLSLPELEGTSRKNAMLEHDALLSSAFSTLPFENHLIIYTGSLSSHSKRQAQVDDSGNASPHRPVLDISPSSQAAAPKKTKGGILHRYQLLTPGLIIILLFVFFVFLPVLYFGISALASIQNPLRTEVAPKGFNASEKKNQ
ncbi:hypothetical protein V5O48_004423 [Marasmius crinis-equi]|uniref:Protein BIG1 n=1 Tax=Marasmius crinis-equi TaxID=585013 RepID=A0ABR3FQ37_9AGAR